MNFFSIRRSRNHILAHVLWYYVILQHIDIPVSDTSVKASLTSLFTRPFSWSWHPDLKLAPQTLGWNGYVLPPVFFLPHHSRWEILRSLLCLFVHLGLCQIEKSHEAGQHAVIKPWFIFLSVLIYLFRTKASADKGKNGHLNPAFHLKVVGPINKASGHKGVSGMCAECVYVA